MTNQDYEKAKAECWLGFRREHPQAGLLVKKAFDSAFDRAYALGKQEKDAEGEEMLMVSRKEVQLLYSNYGQEYKNDRSELLNKVNANRISLGARIAMLEELFGPKCLPGGNSSNVDEIGKDCNVDSSEPKSAEPKFKVGDIASYVCSPTLKHKCTVTKVMQNEHSDKWEYNVMFEWGKPGMYLPESDLEPYTEPKNKDSEFLHTESVGNLRISSEKSHLRNLSQETANFDKEFDNILKGSFSKERRLSLAVQMMQSLVCAPPIPGVDPNPPAENLAQTAFRLADALIAESELTEKLKGE